MAVGESGRAERALGPLAGESTSGSGSGARPGATGGSCHGGRRQPTTFAASPKRRLSSAPRNGDGHLLAVAQLTQSRQPPTNFTRWRRIHHLQQVANMQNQHHPPRRRRALCPARRGDASSTDRMKQQVARRPGSARSWPGREHVISFPATDLAALAEQAAVERDKLTLAPARKPLRRPSCKRRPPHNHHNHPTDAVGQSV